MNWKYHQLTFEYEEVFDDASWPWVGHKNFAYDLIVNAKPRKVVELGTHYGTSLWSFAQAAKDHNIDVELNAVDTWQGERHAGFYDEEVFETVKKIKDQYYGNQKISLIRKTFDEALDDFQDDSIDLLHIDGLHTYEAVKHDFETWFPKLNENGIVLFHDIKVGESDFGVYRLWEELKKKYKTIEFHHSYGLGVLLKNGERMSDIVKNQKELQIHYYYIHEKNKNVKLEELHNIFQMTNLDIENKNKEISILKEEIRAVKSSKFWQLRNNYINLKNGVMSLIFFPRKIIKKYFKI